MEYDQSRRQRWISDRRGRSDPRRRVPHRIRSPRRSRSASASRSSTARREARVPAVRTTGAADEFDNFILRAENNDGWQWNVAGGRPLYSRDEWAARTQLEMGQPAVHGHHVHVYINGVYWGMYNLVERPDDDVFLALTRRRQGGVGRHQLRRGRRRQPDCLEHDDFAGHGRAQRDRRRNARSPPGSDCKATIPTAATTPRSRTIWMSIA